MNIDATSFYANMQKGEGALATASPTSAPAPTPATEAEGTGEIDAVAFFDGMEKGEGALPPILPPDAAVDQDATPPAKSEEQKAAPHGFQTEGHDPETVSAYAGVVRDLGIAQPAAQKLLDKMGPVLAQRQQAQVQQVIAGWQDEARRDSEIGGDGFDGNLAAANQLLRQHGTPALRQWLRTGAGSNPELVRLLVRIARSRR